MKDNKKRLKNFLLITPALTTEAPTNLGMLASVLKEEGFSVFTAVNTFKHPLFMDDYVSVVKNNKIDIVGISMLTIQVLEVYALIKTLKNLGCVVIVGGAHATDVPEEPLRFGADIVVRGEGEETLRELCKYWREEIKLSDINGITFYDQDNKVISTPSRCRVNISKLPQPDFEIFQQDLFKTDEGLLKGFHRIYTSRGCPGRCTFCDWSVFGQGVQFDEIPTVMKEIQRRVKEYGITSFTIADDCFTTNQKRVEKFCEEIVKINPPVIWRCVSRASLVNEEMLRTMKEAGCHSIGFGLESGDQDTLIRIKKGVKLEHNQKSPKLATAVGLQVFGCLMTGFPWEKPENVENTIKLVRELWDAVYLFQISGALTPFPGTAIYQEFADQYGFKEYWLKPEFQLRGDQTYQNSTNPYKTSTFYQRNLFDDTYIQEEIFFTYSREYKEKVTELVFTIGLHNLESLYPKNKLKRQGIMFLSKISWVVYKYFPNLEKKIFGRILHPRAGKRSKVEGLRDRKRGFVKNKKDVTIRTRIKNTNPNV
jgi:radical SAM superfamily enzyme YgiQ (UPF0313 family)